MIVECTDDREMGFVEFTDDREMGFVEILMARIVKKGCQSRSEGVG